MKLCPKCQRQYTDATLNFCLDDGEWLLEGPASGEESKTAILHLTEPSSEAPTRAQIHTTTGVEAEPQGSLSDVSEEQSSSANRAAEPQGKVLGIDKRLLAIVSLLAVIVLGGFFGYRYLLNSPKRIESIAVMPFVNDGQNPDLEYLSDGMTETLMNSLSQLPGLSVKARSSVFRYKGKETDAQTIGKELGVQAILNGRMIKRGDNLTLFLELVDANTGDRKWGEQYTEAVANLITLQNHIARDVSEKLSIKLSGTDQKKLGKNYTTNAEAYQLYLQGRFFLNKRTVDAFRTAIPFFEKAIAIDPNYALAYTGLSDAYMLLGIYVYAGGVLPKEVMPKAKEAALKALSLDNDLAEGHESFGHVIESYDFDWAAAEKEYKRAIELNPNLASAHGWYSGLLAEIGRYDEALAEIQRAVDLDPVSLVDNRVKGRILVFARKTDEAIEQLKKTFALDPNFSSVHSDLSMAYQIKGNYAESVEEFAKFLDLSGDKTSAALARESFLKGGWKGFLQAMTDRSRRSPFVRRTTFAVFYISLGEKDSAMNELNAAYDERRADLRTYKQDPRLDPIRDDPRFQELYKKVGLP